MRNLSKVVIKKNTRFICIDSLALTCLTQTIRYVFRGGDHTFHMKNLSLASRGTERSVYSCTDGFVNNLIQNNE